MIHGDIEVVGRFTKERPCRRAGTTGLAATVLLILMPTLPGRAVAQTASTQTTGLPAISATPEAPDGLWPAGSGLGVIVAKPEAPDGLKPPKAILVDATGLTG